MSPQDMGLQVGDIRIVPCLRDTCSLPCPICEPGCCEYTRQCTLSVELGLKNASVCRTISFKKKIVNITVDAGAPLWSDRPAWVSHGDGSAISFLLHDLTIDFGPPVLILPNSRVVTSERTCDALIGNDSGLFGNLAVFGRIATTQC
jgi:hypothetical protein